MIGYSILAKFGETNAFRTGRDEGKLQKGFSLLQYDQYQKISHVKFKAKYYSRAHGQVSQVFFSFWSKHGVKLAELKNVEDADVKVWTEKHGFQLTQVKEEEAVLGEN